MSTDHAALFAFEDDFVTSLRCIPMAVRFKLDQAGVKISLRQWSRFLPEDRRSLLTAPCADQADVEAYRQALIRLLTERTGEDAKGLPVGSTVAWDQADGTAQEVVRFAQSLKVAPPADAVWRRLTNLQRFVLLKLSRDNHDNVNFIPALEEFDLLQPELKETLRSSEGEDVKI